MSRPARSSWITQTCDQVFLRLPDRFSACELLLTRGNFTRLTNTFNSPYLTFTLPFPPKLNQLLLTSQILWIGHSPTWSLRIKNLPSNPQVTSIPFQNILHIHPVLFISIVIILVQSFNYPFNKYIPNTYNMLNAIYQVLC